MSLFVLGNFTLHSGSNSRWKIDCDALEEEDWATIAHIVGEKFQFSRVVGISRGGLPFQRALESYCTTGPTLIVDDVLTTGRSMYDCAQKTHGDCIGVVLFSRGVCPDWITPIFQMNLEGE